MVRMTGGNLDLFTAFSREVTPLLAEYRARIQHLAVERKPDRTLITEADRHVQAVLVDRIREVEPSARIVAEEGTPDHGSGMPGRTWVIDPIDGTASFVDPDASEFCSVVAMVDEGVPVACWILAPELGPSRSAVEVVLGTGGAVLVNGRECAPPEARPWIHASATRSSGTEPAPFESLLHARSVQVKTRTTSQTLDQVRVCCDLVTVGVEPRFDWFFRRRQKVWDGVAGMALALRQGLAVVNDAGEPLTPLSEGLLSSTDPVLGSALIARPEDVDAVVALIRKSPALP